MNSTCSFISHIVKRNENVSFKFWEISTKEIQKFADKFLNFSEQEVGVKNATRWYQIKSIQYGQRYQRYVHVALWLRRPKNSKIRPKFPNYGGGLHLENIHPKEHFPISLVQILFFFLVNIWMLFCIQSVWSVPVFWKQIKLIPKCTFFNQYLKQKCLFSINSTSKCVKIVCCWAFWHFEDKYPMMSCVGDVLPPLSASYNCLDRRNHINYWGASQFNGTLPEIVMPSVTHSQATPYLQENWEIYKFEKL